MPRLVVISGPANSGKWPLAQRLMADDPTLIPVHRDAIRDKALQAQGRVDEWTITQIMGDTARRLLIAGKSVIAVAWNLEATDKALWTDVAFGTGVSMDWLDVRQPDVATLIPPLEEAA